MHVSPLPPPRFPYGAQHSRAKVHPSELKPGPAVVDTHVQGRACVCVCVLFLTSKINKRDIPQKGDKVNRGKGGEASSLSGLPLCCELPKVHIDSIASSSCIQAFLMNRISSS